MYLSSQALERTEQVHLDQENRTEKETVDHNSERTDIWPEAAVFLFLEVFRAKEDEFKKTKRHNKIWQEMADELQNKNKNYNYTASQCANKISGLKRTYKTIKDQNRKLQGILALLLCESVMESIFGDKAYVAPPSLASSEGPEKDLQPSTSTALDTPIKWKKKDNAIDILGEIQKSNNDFRVYLEKKQKRDEERLKLEVEKVAVQKSLLSFLEKSINKD
nr:unnamed protein product [Callosobruchus analis]